MLETKRAAEKAYRSQPLVNLSGTVFGMYGGYANASGSTLQKMQASSWEPSIQIGWKIGDLNLSSIVSAADAKAVFENLNKVIQVP